MAAATGRIRKVLPKRNASLSQYEPLIKDILSIVLAAREGVSAKAFFELVEWSHLRKEQMAELLSTSLKTLDRYRQQGKNLNPVNGEQVLKLMVLFKKGQEVFGDVAAFGRWLEKPAFGLGGQVPFQLMYTSGGIDLVTEELVRIEYGDLA